MKKFEEEINKKVGTFDVVGHHNGVCCLFEEVKALGKDWVSPEDHQAEIAKLNSKIDWLHGLLDERNEEVLQTVKRLNEAQSEIPEVPQFVADWLDKKPLYTINSFIPVEIIGWSKKQTGYADLGMNINLLLKLKVNGYTVAKEKRFYLKHIEMSKRDVHHDYYAQIRNERFEHDSVESGLLIRSPLLRFP